MTARSGAAVLQLLDPATAVLQLLDRVAVLQLFDSAGCGTVASRSDHGAMTSSGFGAVVLRLLDLTAALRLLDLGL